MSNIKFLVAALALIAVSAPNMVQAQSFSQIAGRRGAVAGAVIGAVIGDQNNRALAGAAIGGLVGNVAGRAIGSSRDIGGYGGYSNPVYRNNNNYRGNNFVGGYGGGSYGRGYGGSYGGGFNAGYRGGSYGGAACPLGGRY